MKFKLPPSSATPRSVRREGIRHGIAVTRPYVADHRVLERAWPGIVRMRAGARRRAIRTARDLSKPSEFAKQYPALAIPLALDVADAANITSVVAEALKRTGGIDVLVNNVRGLQG